MKAYEDHIFDITKEFETEKGTLNTRIDGLNKDIVKLELKNKEVLARLRAKEISNDSEIYENENSIEFFDTLEAEKKAFAYFNKKWAKVKKGILAQEKKNAIDEVKNKKKKRKEKKVSEQE